MKSSGVPKKQYKTVYAHLSVKAIESSRLRIMNKLNIHNIAELVKYAICEGLTTLEY